jgi:hypothetical protein
MVQTTVFSTITRTVIATQSRQIRSSRRCATQNPELLLPLLVNAREDRQQRAVTFRPGAVTLSSWKIVAKPRFPYVPDENPDHGC